MVALGKGARVVVTGVSGFVGPVLARELKRAGFTVVGISDGPAPTNRLASIVDEYITCDLSREWPDIGDVDGIVHLAGLAAVGPSFAQPQRYIDVNSAIATNIFEDLLARDVSTRVLIVSSGAVYGTSLDGIPLAEDAAIKFTSPYVVSKILVENLTAYYRERGVDALVVRPFNHIGPGQRAGFIVPDLAARLRGMTAGSTLETGNLDSARDYTDVRDVARAYRLLLSVDEPRDWVFNVASGAAMRGREILSLLAASLGMDVPPTYASDLRPVDPSVVIGDACRLNALTGWRPSVPVAESISDFLHDSQF